MPEIIQRTLQDSPILLQWYSWGAIAGFVGALAIAAWISSMRNVTEKKLRCGSRWPPWRALSGFQRCWLALMRASPLRCGDSLGLVAGFSMGSCARNGNPAWLRGHAGSSLDRMSCLRPDAAARLVAVPLPSRAPDEPARRCADADCRCRASRPLVEGNADSDALCFQQQAPRVRFLTVAR